MNIALIVDHDIEITNGASLHTKQFLKWLADKNHYVHVMFPSREKMGCSNYGRNIKCHPIPAFSVPSYKEYCVPLPPLACSLWLRKWNIDLIHAETINPTLLLLGFWIKWCTKAPLFNVITANIPYYVHILFPKDNFIKTSCLKSGQAMMNWISNNIEGTFVLSEGVRKSLTDDFLRINQKKVFSLNRPIDLLRFSDSHGGAEIFNPFNVPRGNRLVTLSRLCNTKNVEFLIRAFAKNIYQRNRDLHLFIGGYGPAENRLKELAAQFVCPNIHFLGKIDLDCVSGFLQEAEYFLYSSLSETFGNVICEAKFSRLPVTALDDMAGVRSQIEDTRTGILVKNHDEEEFATRFFELHDNPELRERIRQNAYRDVMANNNPDKIYQNLMNVYHKYSNKEYKAGKELLKHFS